MTIISISAHTSLVSDKGFCLGSSARYAAVDTWFFTELCIFMFYNHHYYYYYYLHFCGSGYYASFKKKAEKSTQQNGSHWGYINKHFLIIMWNYFKKITVRDRARIRKMAESVKFLLCKHKDLSLDPSFIFKAFLVTWELSKSYSSGFSASPSYKISVHPNSTRNHFLTYCLDKLCIRSNQGAPIIS